MCGWLLGQVGQGHERVKGSGCRQMSVGWVGVRYKGVGWWPEKDGQDTGVGWATHGGQGHVGWH